jgi:branched-chain amino acid transport system substrate-binding protein
MSRKPFISPRKFVAAIASIFAVASVAPVLAAQSAGAAPSPFVFGVTSEFSGTQADLGQGFITGLKAGLSAFNSAGGVQGRTVKVITMDDNSNPTLARSNVTSFNNQGAIAVGGFTASNTGPAAFPLSAQDKLPFLVTTFATATMAPNSGYQWIWATNENANSYDQQAMLLYAKKVLVGVKNPTVAITYIDTPSGVLGDQALQSGAAKNHWAVVSNQAVELTGTDVAPAIGSIVSAHPNLVLATMAAQPEVPMLSGLRSAGYTGTIVNYGAGTTQAAYNQLKDPKLVGLSAYPLPSQTQYPGVKTFTTAVAAQGGSPNGIFVSQGYTQGIVLAQALKMCGVNCNRNTLRTTLNKFTNFNPGKVFVGPLGYSTKTHVGLLTYAAFVYQNGNVVQKPGTLTVKP